MLVAWCAVYRLAQSICRASVTRCSAVKSARLLTSRGLVRLVDYCVSQPSLPGQCQYIASRLSSVGIVGEGLGIQPPV